MDANKTHKVTILSRSFATSSEKPLELLQENGFEINLHRNDAPEDTKTIAELIGNSDAIITGSDVIDRYVMDHCPNLRIISKHGVGLDSIDLDLARERGITVTKTPNTNNESVADLAVLLMLNILRDMRQNEIHSDTPDWKSKPLSNDLYHKTVGIVGMGQIGKAVAHRVLGFSCKVLAYDPFPHIDEFKGQDVTLVSLEELLRMSDVVSLHLPLMKETEKIINRKTLSMMRPSAILINTSRGGIIDEADLYQALTSKTIAAVGMDVFAQEPPVKNPLLTLPNVVATPHVATHTEESNYRMGMAAAQNVISYFMASRSCL